MIVLEIYIDFAIINVRGKLFYKGRSR